jgi:hypothetical protein
VTISGGNYVNDSVPYSNSVGKYIAYNSGTWIAVGSGIWRSTNGTSWTYLQNGGGGAGFATSFFDSVINYPRQVYYSNNRWVIVGKDVSNLYTILYSTNDGLNWNIPSGNPFDIGTYNTNSTCNSIATNGGSRWVGVGSNSADASKQIYVSNDNAGSFTPATFTPALDQTIFTWVTYGANKFVAVASQDAQGRNVWYSADGSSWVPATNTAGPSIPIMSGGGARIAYNGTQFVAIGTASGTTDDNIYYSPDGINWTKASSTVPGQLIYWTGYGIKFNSGMWVAVGYDTSNNNLWTSPDGITWTPGVSAVTGTAIFDNGSGFKSFSGVNVDWGNNRWVAVGGDQNTNFVWSALTEPCFLEGSNILTDKGYVPVEQLKVGDMVKTVNHGFVAIQALSSGKTNQLSVEKRLDYQLYVCPTKNFPEAFEDLVITGFHSILVKDFPSEEEKKETEHMLSGLPITDGYYLLPSRVDRRTEIYDKPGMHNVYHVCLECEDDDKNYGIYANGILVESISKNHLLIYGRLKVD